MAAHGGTPLTVDAVAAVLRGDRPRPARPFAVTFDDGFADNLEAVERLGEHGIPATVFVTTSFLGRPAMLDRGGLRRLAALGPRVQLGAHSRTHPRLDELRGDRLRDEIAGSRAALEELAGVDVRSFAYPHGAYDARVRAAVIEAGMTSAAAVKNALSHPGDDPFAIARWTVGPDAAAERIARVLEGADAPLAWRRERLRTRGHRLYRRARRRLGHPVS